MSYLPQPGTKKIRMFSHDFEVYEKVIKMLINFNVDTLVSKPGY